MCLRKTSASHYPMSNGHQFLRKANENYVGDRFWRSRVQYFLTLRLDVMDVTRGRLHISGELSLNARVVHRIVAKHAQYIWLLI